MAYPSHATVLSFLAIHVYNYNVRFRSAFLEFFCTCGDIFGLQKVEVAGGWRRLHNEELHNLYASNLRAIQSKRMRFAGHVARMEYMIKAYKILVGKPEGKRPVERPRRRW
jgi:hypothetical protein